VHVPTRVHPQRVLAITATAAFVASLDLFIVNVAFSDIGKDFSGTSLTSLSWILNGYAIIYAALLIPLGRLADRSSRKNGFLAGLALFTVASAACAAAPDLGVLIGARVLQAVGAAALTPTSLGLLLPVFPPERRAVAVRIWAASGALAAALGPAIGGLLVQASWRWVFIVNVPIGVLGFVAAVVAVPDSRDPAVSRRPDLLGAVFAAVAVGALALGLVQGHDWGWSGIRVVGSFVVAVLATAAFWRRSQRHPVPVVEPALVSHTRSTRCKCPRWRSMTTTPFRPRLGRVLAMATPRITPAFLGFTMASHILGRATLTATAETPASQPGYTANS